MSAHTPGPWTAVHATVAAQIDVMEIAEVADMRVIPASIGWPTAGAPKSDARLIAAAPELLEALQDLCDTLGECGMTEKARAAIAKAEGKAT